MRANLVPVNKYAWARVGPPQFLVPVANRDLWVVERGEQGRTIDPENVAATETLVTVYEDDEGLVEADQPLQSGLDGSYRYWHRPDSVDYFSADDPVEPITPAERPPGWPFRGGGLLLGVPYDTEPPNPGDYILGGTIGGGVEPGFAPGGRGASQWALRIPGWFLDSETGRSTFLAAIRALEFSDPAEMWLIRVPGINKATPTGGEEYDRKHPVGISTTVAVPALAGANQLYVVDGGWGVPGAWDGTSAVVSFKGDGQPLTWASKTSIKAWLSGDADFGDTEVKIVEGQAALPDAAVAFMSRGNPLPRWTGKELLLDAEADGLHKAGATTIVARNVPQDTADELAAAGSFQAGARDNMADIRVWAYESFTYDPGTQKATFTMPPTAVDRRLVDGAPIKIHKFTGVTSDFQMPTKGHVFAGADTLVLDYDHSERHASSGPPPTQAELDKIPSSGMARIESWNRTPASPGQEDFPVKRRAYTDFDSETGEITFAEPLDFDVRDDSWVWIEGCPGLMRARPNGKQMRMHRLNGVAGLAAGVDTYDIFEPDPRFRCPGSSGSTGFLAGMNVGVTGIEGKNAQMAIRALEDATTQKKRGGEFVWMTVVPGVGLRKQVMTVRSRGVGIGVASGSIAHRLHVADWTAKTKPPGFALCDPEEDPDCEEAPGTGGQILSGTLYIDHHEGALVPSTIKLTAYNNETDAFETIELAYTAAGEEVVDGETFQVLTGVTLASGTGVLGDYFVDANTTLQYADSVVSQAIAAGTGVMAGKGRSYESIFGGPFGLNGEPGFVLGPDGPAIYLDADDRLLLDGDPLVEDSQKGAADGVAPLDVNARVPVAHLPSSAFEVGGFWDAATNTPTLSDATGEGGQLYVISVAGTRDLGSGSEDWEQGRIMIHNGSIWEQGPGDLVVSVNGQQGVIVLDHEDVGAAADDDPRLSDARTPTAHAASHELAGSDPLDPSDWNLAGTHAARPAAGIAGRTYFETDTHVLYRDTGAAWQAISPGFVRKTADQILTPSSTTLQDVTGLAFPVEIGEIWLAEVFLMVQAHVTADWKFGWGGTATYRVRWGAWARTAIAPGAWNAVDPATTPDALVGEAATVALGGGGGAAHPIALTGRVGAVTVAGTVQLRAAQNTANATDNIIRGGSTNEHDGSQLRLTRLN